MLFANKGGKAKKPAQKQDGTEDTIVSATTTTTTNNNNNNNNNSNGQHQQQSHHVVQQLRPQQYQQQHSAPTSAGGGRKASCLVSEQHRSMPLSNLAVGLVVFVRDKTGAIKYLLLQDAYSDKVWTPPKGYLSAGDDEKRAQVEFTVRETGLQPSSLAIYENFNFKMQIAIRAQVKKITYGLAEVINSEVGIIPEITVSGRDHLAYFWLTASEAAKVCGSVESETLIKKADKFIKEQAPSQGWESRDAQ